MGIASAIIGSAIIGGVSSSRAAKKQARAMQQGTDASIAEQRRQYDQTRKDYAPYRAAGYNALADLQQGPTGFETSPGYEWVRNEGLRDLGNQFAVRGSGGNAMRALNEYNQNLASQEYGNWYNRWYNRTAGLANLGMGGTAGTAAAGSAAAGNISNSLLGNARAQSQAIGQRYSGINNAIQSGLGNFLYAKNAGMFGGGSPGVTYTPSGSPGLDYINVNYPYKPGG